jgi:hypothetical protein
MVDSAEDQKIHRPMVPKEVRGLDESVWLGRQGWFLASVAHCLIA